MNTIKRFLLTFVLLLTMIAIASPAATRTRAQSGDIVWSEPINISNSPDLTSTDPFLLADPAGGVHLFWAEKASAGAALNPDTLMYSYWDGETWSRPVDIFFSPESDGNPIVGYPHAVMDESGRIHLFWLSEPNYPYYALNYSSVPAGQAEFVSAWEPPVQLADDLTGTKYSIQVAYTPPDTLHLIYASGAQGEHPNEDRTVRYARSTDLGQTWSEPVDLFTSPVLLWGTSDTRIVAAPPNNLYASWTLWGDDGNGYQVYFTRSKDNGLTWDTPIVLAENRDDEYERDWNNLVPLDDNLLMAMWEGGWRAYRQAQYSRDGGATWSEPIDTFPRLIGDNGFVEFARDSNGTWHSFVANRLREGIEPALISDEVSLWHSVWQGGTNWREPTQAITGAPAKAMTNPKVAIVNGNRIVAAWYGSQIYEIYVATGVIPGAPAIPPKPWPGAEIYQTPAPTAEPPSLQATETVQPTPTPFIPKASSEAQDVATFNILFGVISSLIIALVMVVMVMFRGRHG
jgi:hypothetical protein